MYTVDQVLQVAFVSFFFGLVVMAVVDYVVFAIKIKKQSREIKELGDSIKEIKGELKEQDRKEDPFPEGDGTEQNIRVLVEATYQLIAETDIECDCVEAWASDVDPHMCAKHAAIEAIKPFK